MLPDYDDKKEVRLLFFISKVLVEELKIRSDSGGKGKFNGVVRKIKFNGKISYFQLPAAAGVFFIKCDLINS